MTTTPLVEARGFGGRLVLVLTAALLLMIAAASVPVLATVRAK